MLKSCLLLGALTCLAFQTQGLSAQGPDDRSLEVVPSVGFAAITRNGRLESGGMSALLEVDATAGQVRVTGYLGAHGIGVGCSDGCDLGGYSVGAALSYVRGPVAAGVGMGTIRRSAAWHAHPHLQVVVTSGRLRFQARLEVPRSTNDLSIPLLVGIRAGTHH